MEAQTATHPPLQFFAWLEDSPFKPLGIPSVQKSGTRFDLLDDDGRLLFTMPESEFQKACAPVPEPKPESNYVQQRAAGIERRGSVAKAIDQALAAGPVTIRQICDSLGENNRTSFFVVNHQLRRRISTGEVQRFDTVDGWKYQLTKAKGKPNA